MIQNIFQDSECPFRFECDDTGKPENARCVEQEELEPSCDTSEVSSLLTPQKMFLQDFRTKECIFYPH